MTYLVTLIWPGEQFELYCAMILVIVEMSSLVFVLSQFRLPTYSWRALFNFWRLLSGMSIRGMVSTGKPLRYGVGDSIVCGSANPAFFN